MNLTFLFAEELLAQALPWRGKELNFGLRVWMVEAGLLAVRCMKYFIRIRTAISKQYKSAATCEHVSARPAMQVQ